MDQTLEVQVPMEIRVILLEDSREDAEILLRIVRSAGLNVTFSRRVDTRHDFREALRANTPNLILADYRLPDFDAFEALAIAAEDHRQLPFIVVSNVIEEETAVRLMREGADDYLLKDRLGRLGEAIRQAMDRRRLRLNEQRALLSLQQALEKERFLRKEAEDANRLREQFLTAVSHELLQPLTTILGWIDLLTRSGQKPSLVPQALETIRRAALQQKNLVDDLLEQARAATGTLTMTLEKVSLLFVLDQCISGMAPAAESKTITLTLKSEVSTASVQGDPRRLHQLFGNLLTNAIKFTPPQGSVTVTVRRADSKLQVEIADTGEGISADFLPHVFDRFRQEDPSRSRHHGGLGLGLSLARHIADLHGGTIHCESSGKGKGTSFIVQLPAVPHEGIPSNAPPTPSTLRPASEGRT